MKLRYYSLLLSLILLGNSAYGSHQRIAQWLGRAGRALSIGLPVGVSAFKAGSIFHESRALRTATKDQVPSSVAALCQGYMASCGKEFSETPISLGSSMTGALLDGSIEVEKSIVDTLVARNMIQEIPDKIKSLPKEQRNIIFNSADQNISHFPVMLRHEAGHLYYGDNTPMQTAGSYMGSMVLAQLGASILSSIRKARLPVHTLGAGASKLLLGVMGGLVKVGVAYEINKVYERHIEHRADAFACSKTTSSEELYAAAKDYEKYHANILISSLPGIFCAKGEIDNKKACESYMALPRWQQRLLSEYYCLKHNPGHPHPLRRARYFEEAAKKIGLQKVK
jgi:hypothetical protein